MNVTSNSTLKLEATCGAKLKPHLNFPRSCRSIDPLMQVIPSLNPHFMLSRRIFQQLTDSFLLGTNARIACASCAASKCPSQFRPRASVKPQARHSSSSTRWKERQGRDFFAKAAKVQGLKSRAAFKLLEVHRALILFWLSMIKM